LDDRDPNEGSIDPMVAEYWKLGEDIQDKILALGYSQETVDGIAVDIHDLLQASDDIRAVIGPAILEAESLESTAKQLDLLKQALHHIEWHCASGKRYIEAVQSQLVREK